MSINQESDLAHVTTLMRQALLNGALGPKQVMTRVEPMLDERQREQVYRIGLEYLARSTIRQERNSAPPRRRQGKSAYEDVRVHADARQFRVGGEWKRLIDCTADEVDMIVQEYVGQIGVLLNRAERYKRLRDTIRRFGVATGRDLPDGVFDAIMTGQPLPDEAAPAA